MDGLAILYDPIVIEWHLQVEVSYEVSEVHSRLAGTRVALVVGDSNHVSVVYFLVIAVDQVPFATDLEV